jgi:hypothetical protein
VIEGKEAEREEEDGKEREGGTGKAVQFADPRTIACRRLCG